MHFSKIAIVLAPLIGLAAARPPHHLSPSGSSIPLPSFSPFPSASPVDHSRSERTTPNCTITDLIHLADLTPRDTLIPLDALGLAAQACLLPQSHLADHILLDALNQAALVYLHRLWDPSFLVDLSRSVMRSSNTTDLTHLADLIHLADPTHLASLTHLAGRTHFYYPPK
ncbi:hypothetical protein TCE0_017f03267 [Talaromyces pinophilus]|uniref:Uncharacterized protein n=1 Tax=Talaromyces pinophilus TaxID=128442 RepID=A0A6V8H1G9_TALPI|nr:hypothetical protein TCE0_017f03267 [Talaromyces pinophilus]